MKSTPGPHWPLALVLLFSLCPRSAPAQPASAPILRAETRVVLVDAVAVDRKNKFVRDLAQKDFRIWEDGKEQKITSFSLESTGLSPERSKRHYIVLFFDTATLGPSTLLAARNDAIRFVESFASPDRYIAVIAHGGDMQVLANFTSDAARLKAALGTLQGFSTSVVPAPLTANQTGRGNGGNLPAADPAGYRSMLASVRRVAASVSEIRGRKALVLFSGGTPTSTELDRDIASTINDCNKANVAVYGVNGRGLIGALIPPPAAKHESLLASLLRTVLPAALVENDSPTILGFQRRPASGPTASPGNVDASGATILTAAPNQDVIRAIVDGTGGLMLGTSNNLPEELGRIAQEQDEYYLLSYTPSVDSPEGSCHTLRVKVDRGGLDIRARKGYCTEKPADPLAGKEAGKDLETRAATGASGTIAMQLQLPWFYSAPNVAQVSVAMDLLPAAVKFRSDKTTGKLHGEFDLVGAAYTSDGSVAARLSDTVKLDFDDQQQVDAFLKSAYHYANQFEIVPGRYTFRLAVGTGDGKSADSAFGKAELPLEIAPWDGKTLSVSAIALSHDAHPLTGLLSGSDDLLLERVRPLVAKGTEVIPTGTNRFLTSERGFFYFEIYEPPLRSRLSLRVRVLKRANGTQLDDSGPLSAADFVRPDNPVVPVAMVMPIASAGLPPGAYRLEVSVMQGGGQDPVIRSTDFEVR